MPLETGGDYGVRSCLRCGLAKTVPHPPQETLDRLYSSGFYAAPSAPLSPLRSVASTLFTWHKYLSVPGWVRRQRAALLDVGCGKGRLMQLFWRSGWAVTGIDTRPCVDVPASPQRRDGSFEIIEDDFLAHDFAERTYNLVLCAHVLEHTDKPMEWLSKIRSLLKPDGHLVISMPNVASLQSRFGKGRWFHLDLPRHLLHFNEASVRKMLAKTGFAVLHRTHWSFEYEFVGWMLMLAGALGGDIDGMYSWLKGVDGSTTSRGVAARVVRVALSSVAAAPLSLLGPMIGSGASIQLLCAGTGAPGSHPDGT